MPGGKRCSNIIQSAAAATARRLKPISGEGPRRRLLEGVANGSCMYRIEGSMYSFTMPLLQGLRKWLNRIIETFFYEQFCAQPVYFK